MAAPSNPRPLIIGHRGASGYRPEHTRSSYELAFALGADAVEPDVVATRDGVLVLRHENDISGTTDVALHPEFVDRRTTKSIDGRTVTGWFTEDFTWSELDTLSARERLPDVRRSSASFDDKHGLMRLTDLFRLVDEVDEAGDGGFAGRKRPLGLVAEIKHATYFESIGLPLDELFARDAAAAGWADVGNRLTVESFEETVLAKIRARGIAARWVYLIEASGAPFDQLSTHGGDALSYSDYLTDAGLAALAERVDGISVEKGRILPRDADGRASGTTDLVDRAHAVGLAVFCWTLRPENRFLPLNFAYGGGPAHFGDYESEWQRILATGVDGIFVDHPDLAGSVLNAL